MKEISEGDHDNQGNPRNETKQMYQYCPDTLVLIIQLEIENIPQISEYKKRRKNKIVDSVFQKWSSQCRDEWETESIDDVTGNIVDHDKTSGGKSHDEKGSKANCPHVFRVKEQEGDTESF